jgi:hypothetical protein
MLSEMIQNVTSLLQTEFPGRRVLPVLGNHDWLPKNKLPSVGTPGDLYDRYANVFMQSGWLDENEAEQFRKG